MKIGKLLSATALVSAIAALPSGAFAQSAATAPAGDIVQEEMGDVATDGQTITVTGSRISRPTLDSTVPITTVTPQEFLQLGTVSLGDALNQLPSLASTYSQANSTRFIGTAGLSLLDLRALGTTRTLVLVNGRRHVGSTPGSYDVDVNTIPADLIEAVDIVTGGNSAVYGSDAIAGVVNFRLRRNYEGVALRGQAGLTSYGDAGQSFISVVAGKNFADGRVNVTFAGEYSHQTPLFFTSRDEMTGAYSGTPGFVTVEPTHRNGVLIPNRNNNGIPNTAFVDGRPGITFSNISLGGFIQTSCPNAVAATDPRFAAIQAQRAANCTGQLNPLNQPLTDGYAFLPNGTLARNVAAADLRPQGGGLLGGLGATGVEGAMLLPGLDRYSANLLVHADLSRAFQPFFEGKYVRVDALQTSSQPTFVSSSLRPTFSVNNPFLTPQQQATLRTILGVNAQNQPITTFSMQRFNNDIGTRGEDHRRETYRFVAGVGGQLTDTGNLRYEIAGNYGRTETFYGTNGNVLLANFNNASDAVLAPAGFTGTNFTVTPNGTRAICRINLTTNVDPGCVPLNLFGFGAPSRAAQDYVLYRSTREAWAEQIQATAYISGESTGLFELPAGPIGFALGGEYRRERAYQVYDDVTASGATFLNSFAPFAPPASSVKEAYGELRVPLLKETPFFNELTLEGAGRVSDYNILDKAVWAYNVGLIWSPTPGMRLRGGYARSVRAPNLSNLYATSAQTFANGLVDPCSQTVIRDNPNRERNCAAAGIPTTIVVNGQTLPWENSPTSGIPGISGGNPNLDPEIGKSWSVGAVFTPSVVSGLTVTVDYYNIEVSQAIASLSGQAVINRCYDDPVTIDNPFCNAITRVSSGDQLVNGTFAGQAGRQFAGIPAVQLNNPGFAFLSAPFNFALLKAQGVDVDVLYRKEVAANTILNLRAIVSRNINRENFKYLTDPDRSDRLHGVTGTPLWQGSFNANIDFQTFDLTYRSRFVGRGTIATWETQNSHQGRPPINPDAFPIVYNPDILYHDLRIGVKVAERFSFYAGVDNVLNQLPPYGNTGTSETGGTYPNLGRFLYAGFTSRF